MKTHLYVDSKKSNNLYCGVNKSHFNSARIMLEAMDTNEYEIIKHTRIKDFCSRCVARYKKLKQ